MVSKISFPHDNLDNYLYIFGFRVVGIFDFTEPTILLRDPELVKKLVVKDFDSFQDHQSFVDENSDKLFGNSLLMMKGEKWRDMRATLSPAFTGSKMRSMFALVSDCAFKVVHFPKRKAKAVLLMLWTQRLTEQMLRENGMTTK